ncbi:hypothetical protein K1T71_010252 [Dendrolimus kikuchii]|uniref:Uncharacterized protein n=1 Tax=Dendrolimus kikuchii TaxID=765133 RepID=A0ACC1CR26_9NEOP|nr:hypothetical protein K1T71_010252 [Dendrolimus kikuchii]
MEIVKNPRTIKGYADCLIEKGPCPPPGKALKENIKEAMTTDCAQCTEKQKEKATETIRYLFRNERKIFDQVADQTSIKMKTFIILSCVLVVAFAQKYSGKLDSVDIKEMLENESIRTNIFNCFTDKGTCAPEFQEIKDLINDPSTIKDNFSEAQLEKFKEAAEYMYEKNRPVYDELTAKHDPTGQWRKEYGLP